MFYSCFINVRFHCVLLFFDEGYGLAKSSDRDLIHHFNVRDCSIDYTTINMHLHCETKWRNIITSIYQIALINSDLRTHSAQNVRQQNLSILLFFLSNPLYWIWYNSDNSAGIERFAFALNTYLIENILFSNLWTISFLASAIDSSCYDVF